MKLCRYRKVETSFVVFVTDRDGDSAQRGRFCARFRRSWPGKHDYF